MSEPTTEQTLDLDTSREAAASSLALAISNGAAVVERLARGSSPSAATHAVEDRVEEDARLGMAVGWAAVVETLAGAHALLTGPAEDLEPEA